MHGPQANPNPKNSEPDPPLLNTEVDCQDLNECCTAQKLNKIKELLFFAFDFEATKLNHVIRT